MNYLGKKGCLTDEERKSPLAHGCSNFTFDSCIDLSEKINVRPYGRRTKFTIDEYSSDVANFIAWWSMNVLPDLNGFTGFTHKKFSLDGFTVVSNE